MILCRARERVGICVVAQPIDLATRGKIQNKRERDHTISVSLVHVLFRAETKYSISVISCNTCIQLPLDFDLFDLSAID